HEPFIHTHTRFCQHLLGSAGHTDVGADFCTSVGLVAGSPKICADSFLLTVEDRFNGVVHTTKVWSLYLDHMSCFVVCKVYNVIIGVAPLICNQFHMNISLIQDLCQVSQRFHLLGSFTHIH